jgi:hypothetical protein
VKKNLLLLLLLCSAAPSGFAQEVFPAEEVDPYTNPLLQRPMAFSLNLGTAGIGVEAKLGVHPKFNLRLGTSLLPINYSGNLLFKEMEAETDVAASFGKVQLLAEYKPFGSFFRVVGGISYFYAGKFNIKQVMGGTYTIGNTELMGSDIGEMDFTADWTGVAPYIGMGLFRDIPKKRFNINIDIGTYYLSAPKIDIVATKLLEDNASNAEQIQKNMEGYRWLPVLQINFNYKLH